jgi:mono/diheme cytochrome c family protein
MKLIHCRSALAAVGAGAVALTAGEVLSQSGDAMSTDVFSSADRFGQRDGETLYRAVCQGCHMPQGEGAEGAGRYPPLAKNENLQASAYPVYVVVNGLRGMPGFATYLDDEQVARIVTYIRTHFGNDYRDLVSPDDVKAVRP